MRVYRIRGKRGISSTVILTMMGASEAPQVSVNSQMTTTKKEFERRVRAAARRETPERGTLPTIATGTSLAAVIEKYSRELERGHELQRQMFPKKGAN